MESQSNDSSSDGDTSPDTKQFQSNQSDSESLDETASSEYETCFVYLLF